MGILNFLKFKKQSSSALDLSPSKIIEAMPGHIYWFDRNEIFLGCNKAQADSIGRAPKDIIGMHIKDVTSPETYPGIHKVNESIFTTGASYDDEEIATFPNQKKATYFSKKMPLKNQAGEVVAILGVSFDLTELLMAKSQATALFNTIIHVLPMNIYWRDKQGRYLGCNDQQAKLYGLKSREEINGKTNYDLWQIMDPNNPNNKINANLVDQIDQEIMSTGVPQKIEEKYTSKTGEVFYFHSQKLPLRNQEGEIIGLVGVSIDITPQKEAERLQLENTVQKNLLEQLEKFKSTLYQFVHDIQSPVSGIVSMAKNFKLPEDERLALRDAAMRVSDMSRNLLSKYKKQEGGDAPLEEPEFVLISVAILDLLTEKRYQFQDKPVRFEDALKDYFAFIQVEPSAFSRMISNIINNAVDALDKKQGKVIVGLKATKASVTITIKDNGKGMSEELIKKIMNNVAITQGKKNGHGIGLTQVRETLQRNHGELKIDSAVGKGTKVTLTFPRVAAPVWIADEIKLGPEDIIVVLDDEDAIVAAWKSRFATALKDVPSIKVRYFKVGSEALNFLSGLSPRDKKKAFLLTDFELMGQGLNGLDIVEQSGVERAVLATSHHMNKGVRIQAEKIGTKILPKQLAPEVSIKIDPSIQYEVTSAPKKVDIVLIEDDEKLAQIMMLTAFGDLQVDHYTSPEHFLRNVSQYARNVKICIDKNFAGHGMDGLDLAEKLHEQGYTRLFLSSGETFSDGEIPDYLKVVPKIDMASIRDL